MRYLAEIRDAEREILVRRTLTFIPHEGMILHLGSAGGERD